MEGILSILIDYLKSQFEIIIYGCGNNGRFLQWIFDVYNIKINYWCDNNKSLWGKKINGIECIPPAMLAKYSKAVIIVSILNYNEILSNLEESAFKKILTWDDVKLFQTLSHLNEIDLKKYRSWRLSQVPELADKLRNNERFHNIYKGKRCFILGNGPSIREQNLTLLQNEVTFTVNQIARNPQFQNIHTNYHFWADPEFFRTEMKCDGDYELLKIMKQLSQDVECFFPYEQAKQYIERFELGKYINVNYYSWGQFVGDQEEIDFTEYIHSGATVVQFAIRLAIYMGFAEIYLLGCECSTILNVIHARTSQYTTVTHCYDIDDKEKERAKNMYFALPMQAYYESEKKILEDYYLLERYCKARGIKLINCTPGGLLDVIERADFEEVIGGNKLY